MDMTLGDLLDTYGLLYNLECGYYYGICSYDLCDRMFEEYDMDTYKEAVVVDPLIVMEVLIDSDEDLIDWDRITGMMKDLGIPLKEKKDEKQ